MGWDLYYFEGERKKQLLEKTCDFLEKYGLEECISKLSPKNRFYYKFI